MRKGERNPMYGVSLRGEANGNWKGGKRKIHDNYVLINKPEHPYCDNDGCVLEHRLIMEDLIGRYLKPSEVVHYLNGIDDDNRTQNLELLDINSQHISIHAKRRTRNEKGQFMAS